MKYKYSYVAVNGGQFPQVSPQRRLDAIEMWFSAENTTNG